MLSQLKTERSWMLSLLAEGLRQHSDYRLCERRYVFKLLLGFHDSALSDAYTRVGLTQTLSQPPPQSATPSVSHPLSQPPPQSSTPSVSHPLSQPPPQSPTPSVSQPHPQSATPSVSHPLSQPPPQSPTTHDGALVSHCSQPT